MPERRPSRLSAVRSPVRSARALPATRATSPWRIVAVARDRLERDVRVELAEDGLGDVEPADDAVAPSAAASRLEPRVRRHDRLAREVAVADVLGEEGRGRRRPSAPRLELRLAPRRRTVCSPSSAGLSVGKSARKWPPRLSSRASAQRATSDASRCARRRSRARPAASRMQPRVLPERLAQLGRRPARAVRARTAPGRDRPERTARRAQRGRRGGRRRGTRASSSTRAGSRRGRRCRRTRRRRRGPARSVAPSRSVTTPPIV